MTEQNQLNWQRDNFENIEEAWQGDLWDRKRLGIQLTNYVDRLQCGAVLALDARWGEGKTWFVRHWQKHLENEDHNVVYLDAFANDYLDDPFLVISSEITACLSKGDDANSAHINTFKEKAAAAYQALLPTLPKVLLTLGLNLISGGILGALAQQVYESGEKVIESATDGIGDKIKESIEAKIESHEADKNTLLAFKQELTQLAEELDKPLVFIIDELDRCRPDFAIRLIERIKHFFDIPKIVFVLVMDKAQFLKVICHNYGYDEKLGEEYLDKFVDFEIPLRDRIGIMTKSQGNLQLINRFLNDIGENSFDIAFVFLLNFEKNITARELKRKINLYALLKKDKIEKNIFIALGLSKNRIDALRDMENISVKIKKMQSGSENISGISMGNFNIEEFIHIVKENFNITPLVIIEYLREVRDLEKLRANTNNENYQVKYNEFLNKYALHPRIGMQYLIFQGQYQKYLSENVWLDD